MLTDINDTVEKLLSEVDTLSTAQYVDMMGTVLENTLALHNDTCSISADELRSLKDRLV